jgi:hypothetical protein
LDRGRGVAISGRNVVAMNHSVTLLAGEHRRGTAGISNVAVNCDGEFRRVAEVVSHQGSPGS